MLQDNITIIHELLNELFWDTCCMFVYCHCSSSRLRKFFPGGKTISTLDNKSYRACENRNLTETQDASFTITFNYRLIYWILQ